MPAKRAGMPPLSEFDDTVDLVFGETFGNRSAVTYFCILMRGYFDESGTHDQSRVTTIAGWMATTDMWRKGLIEWEAALSSKNIPAFHASEFDYFTRENRWSREEYSHFIELLTTILRKYTWFGVSGSVVTSAYNELPEWLKTKIGGRYHFCFHVVMNQLMKEMENIISPNPMALVFERKDDVIGRTVNAFNKEYASYDFSNKLGRFVFGTKEAFPLLQTADFLVYEMNKWIDNALHVGNPVRLQIEMMIKARRRINAIRYQYHDEGTLAELVAHLERGRSEVTAGKAIWEPWWPASWHKTS